MKSFKIILMSVVFLAIQSLEAEDINSTEEILTTSSEFEPQTDDKLNSELLNTLPAVNILNLSGVDCDDLVIRRFIVHTLPNANTGTLYLEDAQTEVIAGQYLTIDETDTLRFDPDKDFEGNATFTYCSVDTNDVLDSTPATVTIPIVSPNVNGVNINECNVTDDNVTHNVNCECKAYERSIPSLSIFASFLMFLLMIFVGRNFIKKEL